MNVDLEVEGIKPTKVYSKNVDVNRVNLKKIMEIIEAGNKNKTFLSSLKYENLPDKELNYLKNKIQF